MKTTLALVILSSLAATASAQELGLTVQTSGQIVRDDGYFALSGDDHSIRADIGLSVEVWNNLAVFAEYEGGNQRSPLFVDLDTDFSVYAARVGAVYRYPLLSWLHPYALVGLGAYWGDIDVEAPTQTYDDTAFGIGAFAMGGLEAIWYFGGPEPAADASFWDRLGIGLANDYGYTFGPAFTFDELVPEDGGGQAVDLGEVDLSGFTWRLGLTIRYLM